MSKIILTIVAVVAVGTSLSAQELLDKVLSRVNGQIVTLSDVRQCRTLKLLAVDGETDDAYRRGLENRLLILREVSRGSTAVPDPDALAVRRREWESSLGQGAVLNDRLALAGMSADALEAWLANDVRIQMFLDERFRSTPAADRTRVVRDWIDMLRQRAGLR